MTKQSLYTGDIRPTSHAAPYPYAVVGIGNAGNTHYEVHHLPTDMVMRERKHGIVWMGNADTAGNLASCAYKGVYDNPDLWIARSIVNKERELAAQPPTDEPRLSGQTCGTAEFEANLLALMQQARASNVHMVVHLRPL